MISPIPPTLPSALIENWFLKSARLLPWRTYRTPYRVWLSEIMLQQTQVAVVVDYFHRFLARFPTLEDLANAPLDDALALWSGLGYYSRCRNLHKTARIIAHELNGVWPTTSIELQRLPGIGSYTAGAIATFCFGEKTAVVDGNIARVLSRVFDEQTPIDTPKGKAYFESISLNWVQTSEKPALLQEGLIELGALVCKKSNPLCMICPLSQHCLALQKGTIHERPQRAPKRARTTLHVVCALFEQDGKFLLEKRPEKGLFGGLHEPPSLVMHHDELPLLALKRLAQERGFELPKNPSCTHIKRVLTHRDLNLYGFRLQPQDNYKGHWLSLHELHQVGVSKAIQVLLTTTFSVLDLTRR